MENQNQQNQEQSQSINIEVPSADNMASRRPLIPASFAFAIICFFFTFCDFKCVAIDQKMGSVTGFELVTGTQLKDHEMMSGRETKGEKIPPNIWAIIAFGAAVIGLGVFLIKEKREALIGTGAGAVGFGSLLILQVVAKSAIEKQTEGQLAAEFQFAYWGALLAIGVAGTISYLRMRMTQNIVENHSSHSTEQPISENLSQPQITATTISQTINFDIMEWLQKNKKFLVYLTTGIIAIFFLIFVLNKTIWSVENKVQKLIDDGLYEHARMLLNNEIQKNPDNEDLYFLLGSYYLATDNLSNANQAFELAAKINFNVIGKIADAYFDEAEKSINSNNSERASNFFTLCIKYNPNKKDKASQMLIQAAEKNLKQSNLSAAYTYAQTAVNFDANSAKTISENAYEIAKSTVNSTQNVNDIIELGEFSNTYNNNLQNEWGLLLKSFINRNSKLIDKYALSDICQKAVFWNSSLKNEMSQIVFQQAKDELSINPLDESAIKSLLNSATSINESLKPEAGLMVWQKISSSLSDLKGLGQSCFLSFYHLCENYGVSSEIRNSDNYQLAFALNNYLNGSKEKAYSIFSDLSQKSNSISGKIASQILSAPPESKINFDSHPFHFKGTWKAWNYRPGGVIITLLNAHIKSSSILLTFTMKATPEEKDCLIFAPNNINERFGSNCEKLYILDDNGKKFYTTTNWIGGNPTRFNSCANQICFNPGEEIILSAEFPMISSGATTIKFVSPDPDRAGHQYEWNWENIKLKRGPFEQ